MGGTPQSKSPRESPRKGGATTFVFSAKEPAQEEHKPNVNEEMKQASTSLTTHAAVDSTSVPSQEIRMKPLCQNIG